MSTLHHYVKDKTKPRKAQKWKITNENQELDQGGDADSVEGSTERVTRKEIMKGFY